MYKLHSYIDNTNLFTGIIDYYLKNRNVTPLFKSKKGTRIKPEAGVPQGSVIGPILFIIFVNDLPPPIYHDTIRTQFADDVITLTRSFTKRKNKITQAKNKLKRELEHIERWERCWRIQVNPNKCKIATKGMFIEELDLNNDILINETRVQTTSTVKVLGFHLNFSKRNN